MTTSTPSGQQARFVPVAGTAHFADGGQTLTGAVATLDDHGEPREVTVVAAFAHPNGLHTAHLFSLYWREAGGYRHQAGQLRLPEGHDDPAAAVAAVLGSLTGHAPDRAHPLQELPLTRPSTIALLLPRSEHLSAPAAKAGNSGSLQVAQADVLRFNVLPQPGRGPIARLRVITVRQCLRTGIPASPLSFDPVYRAVVLPCTPETDSWTRWYGMRYGEEDVELKRPLDRLLTPDVASMGEIPPLMLGAASPRLVFTSARDDAAHMLWLTQQTRLVLPAPSR